MGDLTKLIARVEALTGPDRDVDYAIHEATNPPLRPGYRFGAVAKYTASLDAAVALTERVLPGWRIIIDASNGVANELYLIGPNYRDDKPEAESSPPISGKPTAIALILATLKALQAKEVEEQ